MNFDRCRYIEITEDPKSPDMDDFYTHVFPTHKFVLPVRSETLDTGAEILSATCPICGLVYMETLFDAPAMEQLEMFVDPCPNYWRLRIESIDGQHFGDVFRTPVAALRWGIDVVKAYSLNVMNFEMTLTDTAPDDSTAAKQEGR